MKLSGRILKEKIRHLSEDNTITKEDLIDILYMSIEEGLSVEEAISDFPLDDFEDMIDLETILDNSDRAYDEYKDRVFER